jgi:arylsulfatase A-like enzyme
MIFRSITLLFAILLGVSGCLGAAPKPNVIFILTDDLGYGDIGILNQNARRAAGLPGFHTPHIDEMAAQGALLSRHYCSAPVCAPSRASLLLGVHQGHANVRDNQFDKALEDNHTLGSVMRAAGYATAVIGKWGLAGGAESGGSPATSPAYPTRRGFDFFFGYLDHSAGHRHYPKESPVDAKDPDGRNTVWEMNSDITQQLDKCYSTDLFTARAKKWIVDHEAGSSQQPFFLYLAYTAPHSALGVPTQGYPSGGGLKGGIQWTGKPGAMINTAGGVIDSWIHPDYSGQTGWSDANKRHATMVRRLDDAVGDLLKLLTDLKIDNNTLVIFTSDNGPHNEGSYTGVIQDPEFFRSYGNMDGIKRDTWEAGIREPTVVRWSGTIPAGRVSDRPSQFHDWMPTLAEVAGLPAPVRSDGVSLIPDLTGSGVRRNGVVYIEYAFKGKTPDYADFGVNHRNALRNQQQVIYLNGYKGIRHNVTNQSADFQIYDTLKDSKELLDLAVWEGVPTQQEFKDATLRVRRPNASAPRPYDTELVPGLAPSPVHPGVSWKAFEGTFPWVPCFSGLTPVAIGESLDPESAVGARGENMGMEIEGYIKVPFDGAYTFYLTADTGAFLRLHEMQLLDCDMGYIGGREISATVLLKAGMHPFTLSYRRGDKVAPLLRFSWSGPGITKQVIPNDSFVVGGISRPRGASGK